MNTKFILSILLSLFFSPITYAQPGADYPPMPDKCPGISAISNVGFNRIDKQQGSNNLWIAKQTNSAYDTKEFWSFSISNIEANDAEEAMSKATSILPTLHVYYGPEEILEDSRWECLYKNDKGNKGSAKTAPEDN